jgi:hypothetical protein
MSNLQEYFNGLPPVRDRRLKTRVTLRSLVDVNFGDTKAIVINVSESGMGLAVGSPPAANDCLIRIRFQLPTSGQSVEIFARIVRLTKSKKGVGVRLINLTPDATAEIANWIASEKSAVDFGQPAQMLLRKKAVEIRALQTKRIFSSPAASDHDENAAARHATIFPSENAYGKGVSVQKGSPDSAFSIAERAGADAGGQIARSAASLTIGMSGGVSSPAASASAKPVAPKQARASFPGLGWLKRNDKADAKGSPRSYIFDLTAPQLAALVYVFALIGLAIGIAATNASVDVLTTMGYGPFAKHVRVRPPRPSAGTQMPTPPPDLASKESPLNIKPGAPPAAVTSPIQVSPDQTSDASAGSHSDEENSGEASSSAAAGATTWDEKTGNTWDPQSGAKTPDADSNSLSSATASPNTARSGATVDQKAGSGPTAQQSNLAQANAAGPQPSADSETSVRRKDLSDSTTRRMPQRTTNPERTDSIPRDVQARSTARGRGPLPKSAVAVSSKSSSTAMSQKHAHPAMVVSPMRNGSKNRMGRIVKSASVAAKPSAALSSKRLRQDEPSARKSEKRNTKNIAPKPGLDSAKNRATGRAKTPSPPNSKPSENTTAPVVVAATPKNAPENPSGPVAKLVAPTVPNEAAAATGQKLATPAANALPKSTAPQDSAPLASKPAAPAAPNPPAPNPILSGDFVSVPSKPGKLQRVIFPQKQIANSSSLAISSQLSVVIPAASGVADQPSRLQAGKLVLYVMPHNLRPGDPYGTEETVRVRATVGRQGFVTDIKPVSGPTFVLSSTVSAVRSWRYKPTLLNGIPVETEQDVTITFKLTR